MQEVGQGKEEEAREEIEMRVDKEEKRAPLQPKLGSSPVYGYAVHSTLQGTFRLTPATFFICIRFEQSKEKNFISQKNLHSSRNVHPLLHREVVGSRTTSDASPSRPPSSARPLLYLHRGGAPRCPLAGQYADPVRASTESVLVMGR